MKNTGRITLMLTIAFCALLWSTPLLAQEQSYIVKKGDSLCAIIVARGAQCTPKAIGTMGFLNPQIADAVADAAVRKSNVVIIQPGQKIRVATTVIEVAQEGSPPSSAAQMKEMSE